MPDIRQVSGTKGSQHPTKPNETYIGTVKHVLASGRIDVSVTKLNVVIADCKVIDNVRPLSKGDRVVCGFLDGQQREMVVYGAYRQAGGIDSSIVLASQIFS